MKVLLIHLPFWEDHFYRKGFFTPNRISPILPIGLASIANFIRAHGFDVEIMDIYAEQLDYKDVISALKNKDFDCVGISALVTQYEYLKWIAKEIKKIKDVPIVLGSGLGTASYEIVHAHVPEVDVCVRGEGEDSFLDLLNSHFNNLQAVQGITFRHEEGFIKNPDRPLISDIDSLPLPAYDLLNIEKYFDSKFYETGVYNVRAKFAGRFRILPTITARGCPHSCNFCGKIMPQCRFRSLERITREIDFLIENYGIKGIHFIDELLVYNKERTIGLCDFLKKREILWDCQGRVDRVDGELLGLMKESGCVAIGFGIESGSQKILDNMNKKITVAQIKHAVSICRQIDLPTKIQLIFGYPGETRETINETIGLFRELRDPGRRFSYITPLPDTRLYEECRQKGLIGDEEQWLYKIRRSFDFREPAINFTTFKNSQIKKLMRFYYNKMVFHHFLYLIARPRLFFNKLRNDKWGTMELLIRAWMYIFRIDFLRK